MTIDAVVFDLDDTLIFGEDVARASLRKVAEATVGFRTVGEFSYPGGGPVVTTMWRPACE